MKWPRILLFVYGAFMIVMGLIGGLGLSGKPPSPISLIAAGGFGALILYFAVSAPKNPRLSFIGTTVLALLNIGQFAPKLAKENTITPILVVAASTIVVLALSAAHFMAKSKAKLTEV